MSFLCFCFWPWTHFESSLENKWGGRARAPFVSPLQRWKVEAKDKQPFLFPKFFFILPSPLPCYSFVCVCVCVRLCLCGLSCSAFGVGPCHKCNPFMINEVAIAMTFPSLSSNEMGAGILQEKKTTIHSPLTTTSSSFSAPPGSCCDN